MSRCGGSSARPSPYRRTHPALAYRRDGMHSRPPSTVGGAQLPSLPQQGGPPQRHHRVLSDVTACLFNISSGPVGLPAPNSAPDWTVYWNFPPFGAWGEFSRAINRIRQMALNSNSPKWPSGLILIGGPRIGREWPTAHQDLRGPRGAGGNSVLCSRKSKF